jgi:hypothetical protein
MKTFEALEWLKNNNNPSALSSDRFKEGKYFEKKI